MIHQVQLAMYPEASSRIKIFPSIPGRSWDWLIGGSASVEDPEYLEAEPSTVFSQAEPGKQENLLAESASRWSADCRFDLADPECREGNISGAVNFWQTVSNEAG